MMIGRATNGRAASSMGCKKLTSTAPLRAGSPDEKPDQELLVGPIDGDPVIVDARFAHHLLQLLEVFAEGLVIALDDLVGLGEEGRASFHVEEPHGPPEVEAELLRVEQVEDRRVVLAEPQVLEAGAE